MCACVAEAILVYQAFKPEIGRYAVANQRFTGCEDYSPTRMTWIKTNFLWMMFRCAWPVEMHRCSATTEN